MQRKIVANEIIFEGIAQIIARGERAIIKTKGESMRPFIFGERDSIELRAVEGEVRRGDILLVRLNCQERAQYVVHRVVEIEGREVVLMGDGNIRGREHCSTTDIIARVSAIIKPNNKRVDPNTRLSRLLSNIWWALLPIRRYLLAILRRLYKRSRS